MRGRHPTPSGNLLKALGIKREGRCIECTHEGWVAGGLVRLPGTASMLCFGCHHAHLLWLEELRLEQKTELALEDDEGLQ